MTEPLGQFKRKHGKDITRIRAYGVRGLSYWDSTEAIFLNFL